MKFNEGDFVKQASDAGRVKLIVAVDRRAPPDIPQMDRFTLQDVDGVRHHNIGAYELRPATESEVQAALAS